MSSSEFTDILFIKFCVVRLFKKKLPSVLHAPHLHSAHQNFGSISSPITLSQLESVGM